MEYVPVTEREGEVSALFLKHFSSVLLKKYARFGPEKVILSKNYVQQEDAIFNFVVREDDVWIVTFPKSGTTWTQEMAWCILHDLDFVGARESLMTRSPTIPRIFFADLPLKKVFDCFLPTYLSDSINYAASKESPRLIKTHFALQLLPKQCTTKKPKIIYVARNPKDMCLSLFHYCRMTIHFSGSIEDFARMLLNDTMVFAPYWSHVLDFWKRRHEPNILFLRYEDMKHDLPSVIRQTADFLGKTLTESQVRILADHLSFAKMKDNPAVNNTTMPRFPMHWFRKSGCHFMRKGEADQWKTDMSPELVQQFDKWIEENTEGTGLTF